MNPLRSHPKQTRLAWLIAASLAGGVAAPADAATDGMPRFVVEQSDTPAVEGRLASVTASGFEVLTPEGALTVSADTLPRVTSAGESAKPDAAGWGRVWLRDGSSLPIVAVIGPDDEGRLLMRTPPESEARPGVLRVPIDDVHSLRLPNSPPGLRDFWSDLRGRRSSDDLIATPRRGAADGPTLDYLEGYVEAIGESSMTVVLDDEPIEAPLAKVYGVVFAHQDVDSTAEARGPLVRTRSGWELQTTSLAMLASGDVRVTTPSLEAVVPVRAIASLDYSVGRVAYLSDLRPASTRLRPLFGTPSGLAAALPAGLPGPPVVQSDRGYWGGPLEVDNAAPYPTSFAKGLAIRSGGEVTYQLDSSYRVLRGVVAIDPSTPGRRLRMMIAADGERLLDEVLTSDGSPVDVRLPINGARRLTLRVERAESLDAAIHFGNARLER